MQLATVACVVESVVSALPEVLVHTLPEADGVVAPEAVGHIRDMRYDSLVVGPGLGDAESFLSGFLPKLRAPACVDADALNWLARSGASLSEDLVLTPHEGEAARLLRISREEVAADRFGAVASLSDKYQCFAVLKGSHTLTRTPQGKTVINPTGNSGMATAGMGDVLSGMIGAALASSAWSGLSVAAMVHLHGLAGDLCANEIGPYGYTASELAARIPKARAKLMPCPVHGSLSR